MNHELAVILAGGLGTRLRSVVSDCPKALAPIQGKPFLHWLLSFLSRRGIGECLLLLGYKAEQIMEYCGDGRAWGLSINYSLEPAPLDKGGALRFALPQIHHDDFLFLNGDTILDVDIPSMFSTSRERGSHVLIGLRKGPSIERMDPVEIDGAGKVLRFGDVTIPADERGEWFVNGGVYVVKKHVVESLPEGRLSWEKQVLPTLLRKKQPVHSLQSRGYFIDIGVPEDYQRAQEEIPRFVASLKA
ncbi:nucleotidyltransferase family protein [Aminobacterium mobile]|uniref:nucleotidyltransferase family protein n=1 Tax=Aminobacterium mobile TaxID=81467 RepID=UPI0004BC0A36|nr:nucleotidyltransferase family protein [Aminobacterium mobile]